MAFIGIVAVAGLACAGSWLYPHRLGHGQIVAALGNRGGDRRGHRRNHFKGVCLTGSLQANGTGTAYSAAPMLKKSSYRVIGRFAIAVGIPNAANLMGRVESIAIRIMAPNGQQWQSGMNNSQSLSLQPLSSSMP
jgi:catalase